VTKTRRVYVTPSPSPTKASKVRSLPLSRSHPTESRPSKTSAPPSYTGSVRSSPSSSPPPLWLVPTAPAAPIAPASAASPRPSPAGTYKMVHPVPHPDEIIRPMAGQHIQGYYVVFRGRERGIFYSW
jgi:hypothetical protein